jgi:hypothetical protein
MEEEEVLLADFQQCSKRLQPSLRQWHWPRSLQWQHGLEQHGFGADDDDSDSLNFA